MPESSSTNDSPDLDRRVTAVAVEISQIETESAQESLIFGHLLAAAYALRRAIACETAGTAEQFPEDADSAMRVTAAAVAEGRQPHESWLAGFYLAAAEERISAAEMRVKRYRDIARSDGLPKQRQFRLGTQRSRIEEMEAMVERLEEMARRVVPT